MSRPADARAVPSLIFIAVSLGLVACPLWRAQSQDNAQPPDAADAATLGPEPNGVAPLPEGFVGDAWGDDEPTLELGPWSLRVLLQTRYAQTFAALSDDPRPGYALREDVLVHDADGLRLQRFFFRIAATPSRFVSFKSILDLSKLGGSDASGVLKQAHALLRPAPKRIEVVVGVFKLPYSILELDPVARFELVDLGSADDLVKNLGFAGRDVGVELMFAPLPRPRWLRVQLGVFRGHARDEHASPVGALGARAETKPVKGLRFGFDLVGMPAGVTYKQPFASSSKDVLPNPPDPLYPREQHWGSGVAYSADLSYSRKGFSVRLEGMLGDRVDHDERYQARSFGCIWLLAAQRFRIGPVALMPAVRAQWLDTDREHAGGGRMELSAALNVLYKKRVRWVFAVTRTQVQPNTPLVEQPRPLPYDPYLDLNNTRATTQLQIEI